MNEGRVIKRWTPPKTLIDMLCKELDDSKTMDEFMLKMRKMENHFIGARKLFYDDHCTEWQHVQAWFHMQAYVWVLRDYCMWDEDKCEPYIE